MLELSLRENISLIVPTIDSELEPLSLHRQIFAENDVCISVSDTETVQICGDKVLTHDWLCANGFPTVRQGLPDEILAASRSWSLPLIAKPRWGSASKGVRVIETWDELRSYAAIRKDLIIQETATGNEHTINVFVNRGGKCICAVPHHRLETRGGEVSKAVTVKHAGLMKLARDIAELLPGARGMLNIQGFLSDLGDIKIIEINARAGGGYPLAHHAGARFTHWILEELFCGRSLDYVDDWKDDLAMLRYDQAIMRPASELRSYESERALSSAGSG
jgi:carbamoyl-phosphate synthase large subunit